MEPRGRGVICCEQWAQKAIVIRMHLAGGVCVEGGGGGVLSVKMGQLDGQLCYLVHR
jgi:hypothetical protein